MSAATLARCLLTWLVILALAVVNGWLRERFLVPALGVPGSELLSGAALCGIVLAVTYLLLPWTGARGSTQYRLVGAGWLALTVAFEFSFGLARGDDLPTLLAAYRFEDGNLWPVVLLVTALSPWLVARLRRLP